MTAVCINSKLIWMVSAEVLKRSIEHGEFYTNEVLLTYNRESVSVSTRSSQHCPGMREEHCETAHLATPE